ncbi:hypothetical protein QF000_006503 [Paraburkholderia atlantica]|uniref:hypothetical protein n=1 Tax=Paraburkholderia atlantica TaxID=2654982 RepID=UPI003D1B8002
MKAERKQQTSKQGPYALTPEMETAIQAVHDALERRAVLDEAVKEAPARMAALEQEVSHIRAEIASREADIVWCDGSEVPAMDKAIKKLADDLGIKETELRRSKARLDALEARAPEIDAAIAEAGHMLTLERDMLAESFKARISEELREAVAPLLPILEKARAVGPMLNDFCQAAYLPDPLGFILSNANIGTTVGNVGVNLLNGASGLTNPIAEAMAPVNATLNAFRAHRAYVPLANRPKPYVIKGSSEGPGGKPTVPPKVEEPSPPRKTIEEALREPYTRKGTDWRGNRDSQPSADLNIAAAIVDASQTD